jgi:RNA polymerase sigma-54 factor
MIANTSLAALIPTVFGSGTGKLVQATVPIGEGPAYADDHPVFSSAWVGARDLPNVCYTAGAFGKEFQSQRLYEEHLHDLGKGRINKIAQQLGVGVQQCRACDFIRSLDPKPGQQTHVTIPNTSLRILFLEKVDEKYVVIVNDRGYPHL